MNEPERKGKIRTIQYILIVLIIIMVVIYFFLGPITALVGGVIAGILVFLFLKYYLKTEEKVEP
jgi:hypothetical protein